MRARGHKKRGVVIRTAVQPRMLSHYTRLRLGTTQHKLHEPLSKLLVSPLITSIVTPPYITPKIIPFKELDCGSHELSFGNAGFRFHGVSRNLKHASSPVRVRASGFWHLVFSGCRLGFSRLINLVQNVGKLGSAQPT